MTNVMEEYLKADHNPDAPENRRQLRDPDKKLKPMLSPQDFQRDLLATRGGRLLRRSSIDI